MTTADALAATDRLRQLGAAIYGAEWVSPLARELGLNLRTVQRWAAGDTAPPPQLFLDLKPIARRHAAALKVRVALLDKFLAG